IAGILFYGDGVQDGIRVAGGVLDRDMHLAVLIGDDIVNDDLFVHIIPVVQGNGDIPDAVVRRLVVVVAVPAPVEAETVSLGIVQRKLHGSRPVLFVPEGGHYRIGHGTRIIAGTQPAHARAVESSGDLHRVARRLALPVL